MPTLYRLKTGKINRRDIDKPLRDDKGKITDYEFTRHVAPYEFVPSVGEYEGNKFRMIAVGQVSADSKQAKEGVINSNMTERIVRESLGTETAAPLPVDITKIKDVPAAIAAINRVTDEAQLNVYVEQEVENKPRVRRGVLEAIERRRDEVTELRGATAAAVLAAVDAKGE